MYTYEEAVRIDRKDPLSSFREEFYYDKDTIYLDGNSLGLLSRGAEANVYELLNSWKKYGIDGWTSGNHPWFYLSEQLGKASAPLVGAEKDEVVVTGSTTVNLHQLVATFYKPKGKCTKILADELTFPSDIYALQSQLKMQGYDPSIHLKQVKSQDGLTLDETEIIMEMDEEVALIVLPSVLYRSGQVLDMKALTIAAHERGIPIGFDLCHSIGALPHELSEWGVDFAFWCNYKYVNGGPGSVGGLYVNAKHFGKTPGLSGWFGSDKKKQFDMEHEPTFAGDVGAYQIGTPHVLSAAPLLSSLEMLNQAGIQHLRERSLRMTDYFMTLIDHELTSFGLTISNPRGEQARGGHLFLEHPEAVRICKALKAEGIIPDLRPPSGIRLAPAPLYNTFAEIWQTVQTLKKIMEEKSYEQYERGRGVVS
ncbi:kynureninase [Geomicrobium halophilum]|uniref:Kynureninase n=1 Tax=Geomicrobium halophilum TaxID=549000 RepID=A0A841PY15_9BACL|nr:kynureninase [Geomicrobium halophilum]